MIENIIKDYLNEKLEEQAFLEKPSPGLGNYVVFEKIGSNKNNHLPSATFAFQSYGESLYKAAELNERVKIVVENLIELDEIRGVSLNSDYNFTDTTTKEYRYQAVFDIKYY